MVFSIRGVIAQNLAMTNIYGRHVISLNGKWKSIIDPFDAGGGDWRAYYKDKKSTGRNDFYEYSFDLSPTLNVPGDFNSQRTELTYFESTVWYKKEFNYRKKAGKRLFVHFGAINYRATVYFNGTKLGEHEGGFTPFQFELTGLLHDGLNAIIVKTNNARLKNGIPGTGFDWFNYGGITRDVNLVETGETFIEDYSIQLGKDKPGLAYGRIKLNGSIPSQYVIIRIPEKGIEQTIKTDNNGEGYFQFSSLNLERWSPDHPVLYKVSMSCMTDSITENIGFRSIEVNGTDIVLNGKKIFLKGVNIHEEAPQRKARAWSNADAAQLLGWAKELGCNFVRLVHYPHNEYMVRLAEKMGLMVWEELPLYQGIEFSDTTITAKMNHMMQEMIRRDKNRSNIIIWSLSNETWPSPERNRALTQLIRKTRQTDSSRLIASAFTNTRISNDSIFIEDSLNELLDCISINEYYGWYVRWPKNPGQLTWVSHFNKPLIMTEFGGEALYNNPNNKDNNASSWSENYQEQIFKDQCRMLMSIPFLRGTCPWILVDFRSPVRNHPVYQKGWNRKGLLSDKGEKKKAWFVMHDFYKNLKQ